MTRATIAIILFALLASISLFAQQSRWATPDDKTARWMIEQEGKWAQAACDHNLVAETLLADDFQGTGTDGKRYTKAEEVEEAKHPKEPAARACKLLDAKVRFFGDSVAVIYGSESRVRKGKDGKDSTQAQVWTDTWLRRNGQWQIIAAQDALVPTK